LNINELKKPINIIIEHIKRVSNRTVLEFRFFNHIENEDLNIMTLIAWHFFNRNG